MIVVRNVVVRSTIVVGTSLDEGLDVNEVGIDTAGGDGVEALDTPDDSLTEIEATVDIVVDKILDERTDVTEALIVVDGVTVVVKVVVTSPKTDEMLEEDAGGPIDD